MVLSGALAQTYANLAVAAPTRESARHALVRIEKEVGARISAHIRMDIPLPDERDQFRLTAMMAIHRIAATLIRMRRQVLPRESAIALSANYSVSVRQ
jgi:hypothetical protein